MAGAGFGAPIYDEEEHKTNGGNGADVEAIDINDPRLVSESLEDNTQADAYKIPPPAPDGFWRAKLSNEQVKNQEGQLVDYFAWRHDIVNDGRPMFVQNVGVKLIDLTGKYHDTKITEQWVKTNIDKRKGTSQATTITVKAGGTPAASPSTEKARLDALRKTLSGEPEVVIETNWEAQCMNCTEAAKKKGDKAPRPFLFGQHRFPVVSVNGVKEFDPNVSCPTCKSLVRAQLRIRQFYKIGEQKVNQGLG